MLAWISWSRAEVIKLNPTTAFSPHQNSSKWTFICCSQIRAIKFKFYDFELGFLHFLVIKTEKSVELSVIHAAKSNKTMNSMHMNVNIVMLVAFLSRKTRLPIYAENPCKISSKFILSCVNTNSFLPSMSENSNAQSLGNEWHHLNVENLLFVQHFIGLHVVNLSSLQNEILFEFFLIATLKYMNSFLLIKLCFSIYSTISYTTDNGTSQRCGCSKKWTGDIELQGWG